MASDIGGYWIPFSIGCHSTICCCNCLMTLQYQMPLVQKAILIVCWLPFSIRWQQATKLDSDFESHSSVLLFYEENINLKTHYLTPRMLYILQETRYLCFFRLTQIAWMQKLTHCGLVRQHRSGSTLAQVMACCLTAPSHYLNQCWLIIRQVQWHPYQGNFTKDASTINHLNLFENYMSKISFRFRRG